MTRDARVEDGPAIADPLTFELTVTAQRFAAYEGRAVQPTVDCGLTFSRPVRMDSDGAMLADLTGALVVWAYSEPALASDGRRGMLTRTTPGHYVVHLYLPPAEAAIVQPALRPGVTGTLRMESGVTFHQSASTDNFWNDVLDPVVWFDESEIILT